MHECARPLRSQWGFELDHIESYFAVLGMVVLKEIGNCAQLMANDYK